MRNSRSILFDGAAVEIGAIPLEAVSTGISAALAATEQDDALAATATVLIQGTSSITEQDDTLAAAGTVLIKAQLAATEADDTLAATGTVGSSSITATLSATEADDTLAATGTVLIQAAASITEADDTLSAAVTVLVQTQLAVTEADDTLVATGVVGTPAAITATLAVTEQDDTLQATVRVGSADAGGGGPDASDAAPERYTDDASGWRKPKWVRDREQQAAAARVLIEQPDAEPRRASPVAESRLAPAVSDSGNAGVASGLERALPQAEATAEVADESIAATVSAIDVERARIAAKVAQQRELEEIMTILMMAA